MVRISEYSAFQVKPEILRDFVSENWLFFKTPKKRVLFGWLKHTPFAEPNHRIPGRCGRFFNLLGLRVLGPDLTDQKFRNNEGWFPNLEVSPTENDGDVLLEKYEEMLELTLKFSETQRDELQ